MCIFEKLGKELFECDENLLRYIQINCRQLFLVVFIKGKVTYWYIVYLRLFPVELCNLPLS